MAQPRRIFTAVGLAVLFLLAAGAGSRAGADDPESEGVPTVVRIDAAADRNGDGRIDREEFHHHALDVFFRADRNEDGVLDPAERADSPALELSALESGPGAGAVSLWHFAEGCFATFRAADADRDGALGPGEARLEPSALSR